MHLLYHLFPLHPGGQATLGDLTTNSHPGDGHLTTNCGRRDRQLTNSCTGRTSRLAARFTLQESWGEQHYLEVLQPHAGRFSK